METIIFYALILFLGGFAAGYFYMRRIAIIRLDDLRSLLVIEAKKIVSLKSELVKYKK